MLGSQRRISRWQIGLYSCGTLVICVASWLWIHRPTSLSREVEAISGRYQNTNRDIARGVNRPSWDRIVYGVLQTVRGKESRTISIDFYKANVTDDWVRRNAEAIRQIPLHSLCFRRTKITDAAVIELAGLRKLAVLDLAGTSVTDQSMAAIRKMPNLQLLNLKDTEATVGSISQLEDHPLLRHLDLDGDLLTVESVTHLNAMPSLGSLGLRDFNNEQLSCLVGLKGLYSLSLTAATEESLPPLLQLSQLKWLQLVDSRLSSESIESIQTTYPNLSIRKSRSIEAEEELGIPEMVAADTRVRRMAYFTIAILCGWIISLLWRMLRSPLFKAWNK